MWHLIHPRQTVSKKQESKDNEVVSENKTSVFDMNFLLTSILALFLIASNGNAVEINEHAVELPECVVITHCIRVDWPVSDLDKAFLKTKEAIRQTPRTEIVEENDSYVHAEATTKWMHYVDDLEVRKIPQKKTLQVRSESRVGIGDNGVNKKRIDDLEYRLTTSQY